MSRKIRRLSRATQALLILGGGLFLSFIGAVAFHLDAASAAGNPTCTLSGSSPNETLTINLFGGPIKLATNSAGTTFAVTPSGGTGCGVTFSLSAISSIQFTVDSSTSTPSTVEFDQSLHAITRCIPISGAVGNSTAGNGTVRVDAADGVPVTVGANGVNLDPSLCPSPFASGTFSGLGAYQINDTAGTSAITLSAAGDATTGGAATVPVTFTAGTGGSHLAASSKFIGGTADDTFTVFGDTNTFQVGTGTDTITDTGVGNTIDFSNISTSTSSHLAVNVSGTSQTVGGATVKNGQAAVGSIVTDTFNASAFTTILGSVDGNTDFLGGSAGGLSFTPFSTGNAADFSADTNPIFANLTVASRLNGVLVTVPAGEVQVGSPSCSSAACFDSIGGLTNVTGSSGGGSTFYGGSAGPYTLTGHGSGNSFVAGPSDDTFVDSTSNNTVDLSQISSAATVDVSGVQVSSTVNDTATAGTATYTFSGLTEPTRFLGSTGGTTFYAGSAADTFIGRGLVNDTLNYSFASGGPLTINVVSAKAVLGAVNEPFSAIAKFVGLAAGNTTFVADGSGPYEFDATGTNDVADFSPSATGVAANLATGKVTVAAGTDTLVGISSVIGSAAGSNTFTAGSGSETFGDTGTTGGDSVNFANVPTSQSTPLTVNVSGSPVSGVATSTAAAGSATYTFNNKAADFTTFAGSANGNTSFLAASAGGLSFTGQGPGGNSVDFSADTNPVFVNLTLGSIVNGALVPVPAGEVQVGPSPCTALSCFDTISGLTNVTGSSGGGSTFYGGTSPASFTGRGSANSFVAGAAGDTFIDSTSNNTVDLSQLSSAATVDVSGVQVGSTVNDTATAGGVTYTFSALSEPTAFVGSTGGTTFYAGPAGDRFIGRGSGNDTLNYSFASGSPLVVCVAASSPQCAAGGTAVLGAVTQLFSAISKFVGLAAGNTTFVADGSGPYEFDATGVNDVADFSPSAAGVNANFLTGKVTVAAGTDTLVGISSVIGSNQGHNTFLAGTSSETFGDKGSIGADSVDFSNVSTSQTTPLTVNVSGSPGNGAATSTAVAGSATYTFNNVAADFTNFTGSMFGNTSFLAGNRGGLTFTSTLGTTGNSADFSAATAGVTVDLTSSPNTVNGSSLTSADTLVGLTTVTGSSAGNSIFEGGSTGPYTFTGRGSANRFVAGTGSATFIDPTSGNIVDLSSLSSIAKVDVSGVTANSTLNDTATAGAATYTFGLLAEPTTFFGSTDATTFYPGAAADIFNGSAVAANTLNYGFAPGGPLTISVVSHQAVLGGVTQAFSNISTFDSLAGGSTTFVSGAANGNTFAATGILNTADYSLDLNSITADLVAGTITDATGHDTISGVTTVIGSKFGHNAFIAGASSETFGETGITGGDSVSFANVATSQSTPLTVNVSGHPVSGAANSTAVVASATYTFNNVAANFTSFTGANTGWTRFDANGTQGGFVLTGEGPSNTVDFSRAGTSGTSGSGVTANMITGAVTSPSLSAPDQLLGAFTSPGNNTVIGSSIGPNTFFGNLDGTAFTAQNPAGNTVSYVNMNSNPLGGVNFDLTSDVVGALPANATTVADSFSFASGPLIAQGSPGNDVFVVGTAAATILGGGGHDTLDLSKVPGPTSGTTGVAADLNAGSVTGPTISGINFTPGCALPTPVPTQLCLTEVIGSKFDDTFTANSGALGGSLPAVQILGGGGGGIDTLDLSQIAAATTVCLPVTLGTSPLSPAPCTAGGSVGAPVVPIGTLTAATGTTPITSLHVSPIPDALAPGDQIRVTSSPSAQTFTVSAPTALGATTIPVTSATPIVSFPIGSTLDSWWISFSGIANLNGTQAGGDHVYAGTGTSTITEQPGSVLGTLDFSNVPLPPSAVQPNIPGVTVTASNSVGTQQGSATSPLLKISNTFFGFGNFVGTQGNDSFTQSGPGIYTFSGGLGVNSLDLSGAPAGSTVNLLAPVAGECSSGTGFTNTDGSATLLGQLTDNFSCISNLVAPSGSTFTANPALFVNPGQTATLNGGGSGTLKLVNDGIGGGATVNLVKDWVTGDGYNFQFSGMSTIVGTPFNDTFIPGSTSVDIIGGGGQDGLSFIAGTVPGTVPPVSYNGAPAAVDVNLSSSSYVIPAGMPNAGTTVPACTAVGGYGGTISLSDPSTPTTCTISNVTGTANFSDTLVAGRGTDTLTGGSGADRFVLTNFGRTAIVGGTGASTLDLSQLTGGVTSFALSDSTPQPLPNSGNVQVISGNIQTVIASPGGSDLTAGFGNATLIGGPGNDLLAAGTAPPGTTQTLIGGGGADTLVGGIGHDVLVGGNQPVTFQPGEGSDTLTSPVAGNTLSYASATSGVQANLSTQVVTVPPGKPFAGTTLAPQTATGGFPGSSVDLSGASINHLIGTPLTDLFVTSGSNDTIAGGGGSDLFIMLNGNNTVSEPSGSSPTFLFQGAGNNIINGGGNGTLDFSDPGTPARVIVNLQAGTATGGFGGTQSLSGIKSVIGTDRTFNDILVAGPPGGVLIGGGTGSDVLEAGPSGDNLLIGGNGNTTFCSEPACVVSGTSTGGGANAGLANHMVGGSGDDTFFVRNNAYDSINGGGGFNVARVDSTKDTMLNIQASCDTAGCVP